MEALADRGDLARLVEEDNDAITLLVGVSEVDERERDAGVLRRDVLVDVRVFAYRVVLFADVRDVVRCAEDLDDLLLRHALLDLRGLLREDRLVFLLAPQHGAAREARTDDEEARQAGDVRRESRRGSDRVSRHSSSLSDSWKGGEYSRGVS